MIKAMESRISELEKELENMEPDLFETEEEYQAAKDAINMEISNLWYDIEES